MTGNGTDSWQTDAGRFNGQKLKNTVVVVTRYLEELFWEQEVLSEPILRLFQEGLRESLIVEKHLCRKYG